jgi:Tryptophan halogenase
MTQLNKISVVGGGTAGFVSALILKSRFPASKIEIIRSQRIGIIGVGEGSTEHWNEFMQYIGVNFKTVIKHCDATFKSGIMFKGWAKKDYLHSTSPDAEEKNGQSYPTYGKIIGENLGNRLLNPGSVWENRVVTSYLTAPKGPFNQYHFNTNKLNEFLTKIAGFKDIKVIDDEIKDIVLDETGAIDHIIGEQSTYKSDFYIDSTGFKKILISKLGAKWQSYSKYLKMKSAITFQLPDTQEYNIWTLAQAMDYGWMFKIPVWGRSGNGYIFDSDYITADQAKEEVEKFLGHEITVGKQLNFDPGALDRVWIKNCCAIGLSASFVEPLEATSIGTSIQQTFLLMHRLPNYDEQTISTYNLAVEEILNNIRDFVILHYVTDKENTQFWRDIKGMELPEKLANNLKRWRKNLPIQEDFRGVTDYTLFKDPHYIHILNGLNLFDRAAIKAEYEMMHPKIKERAEDAIRNIRTLERITPTMGHKEFIAKIRAS